MTFEDAADAVLRPKNQSASGVLRCADLYCGDGEATQAALDLGMRVVYAYDPSESVCEDYLERFGQEPFAGSIEDSIEVAPKFDLLLVRLNQGKQKVGVEHALRFMREREIAAAVFWGRGLPDDFLAELSRTITEDLNDPPYICHDESFSFVVVGNVHNPFPCPSVLSLSNIIAAFA